ncbi:myocardin-related transcription factor A [Bombina bombina]|uniref:myocardin-related transcription factor A n=1 Tax=Bombina bombina TaxID=8345 RepID=UPI00235B163F|nr:myocardin-related transcription factor A [Bombina bombina]
MPIVHGETKQVPGMKTQLDFRGVTCLPPNAAFKSEHGREGRDNLDEESVTTEGVSAPSPQSEAVTNDLQELSLQPGANMLIPSHTLRPSTPPLSERKNVLQLKLQQRRTREELVCQGIMPPLKSPAAFHEQRRSLERARTEDYLKRKIRSRPERAELVRMHILEETSAEPSLQAKQLKLKRARLADDLNEKISQRPGPMELVVKNILPVETSLKDAIIDVDYPKLVDSSSFDEDSSDALSPEQPASQESQGSVPSPAESRSSEVSPAVLLSPCQALPWVQLGLEATEAPLPPPDPSPAPALCVSSGLVASVPKPFPALIKHSQPKATSDKFQRSKKAKEPKPKVKKLKYHQYIPPDQKQKGSPALDSAYAKILQQQQLFLQLQILNQQQHQHYNYQTILPAPPKPLPDQQHMSNSSSSTVRTMPTISIAAPHTSAVARQSSNMTSCGKPGPLPPNLDDLKVAELKQELKQRGLPVSGTKTDLIERLKASQDPNSVTAALAKPTTMQQPRPSEVFPAFPNPAPAATELGSSSPPPSPCHSEVSVGSLDEASIISDTFCEIVPQHSMHTSPVHGKVPSDSRDKDFMLLEKDRQIEELTRRLKQKQELVERLRQQLEQEKHTQQQQPFSSQERIAVKVEHSSTSFGPNKKGETSESVKLESKGKSNCQQKSQLFLSSVPNVDNAKNSESGAQIVFTVTSPSAQLPDSNRHIVLQSQKQPLQLLPGTILSFSAQTDLQPFINLNGFHKLLPVSNKENSINCSANKDPDQYESPTTSLSQPEPEPPPQSMFLTPSLPAWTKDPPGYDEAVNQPVNGSEDVRQGSLQAEDMFDILLRNLDIPLEFKEFLVPCHKQASPPHNAAPAVPQVQIPSPPSPNPTSPVRLEDFLESSTGTQLLRGDGSGSMPLIDDLHSQMLSSLAILDHPPSPMDTSDLHFSPAGDSLGLDISEPPLDGMDWLELSGPPAMNLAPLSTATPSVFSTDFLDSHDLQLHWDSCL